jgi:hypothetical protein
MGGYLNRIEELRLKCVLRSQVRKAAVAGRCMHSQARYEELVRTVAEGDASGEGKYDGGTVHRRDEGATGHLR